jgi:hypothetical protein
MKTFVKGDTEHIVYESVGDFFRNTDPHNPLPTMNSDNTGLYEDIKSSSRDSWRFGDDKSREKFYDNRFNPTKGKNKCYEQVKKTMADKQYKKLIEQARTYRKRITFEDHGFRLNVAKALSGEDRIFGVYKNARKATVKIAINISGSCSVSDEAFAKIASTAIPTIYALEQAGICTEVWYCEFSSGVFKGVSEKHAAFQVKMKSAQERFSWTTFAPVFCLGSFRESFFLSAIYSEHKACSGLGRPMDASVIKEKDNYGYDAVIGLNAVGPVTQVNSIFEQLHKTKS